MFGEMKSKWILQLKKQNLQKIFTRLEKANYYQNRVEHWDVKGILDQISNKYLKFDVKARKRLIE